ncbi:hypothetical protein Cni_G29118 [Canna indica]|uniref:DEUBAD domain-containing protein n=1 Tax=Canna indica TaxID=4628 RepID=A0AAQ3L4A1_9LILI|nr:hypothetical protein Cni_G29118 [Canna indica]
MTCRMAAGHQKKRLASFNIHEQQKGKKKKRLDSSDYILHLRFHIDLEWDDNQRRVVAKKEQIGLSWADFTPFLDFVSRTHSGLADIVSVPDEIFTLDNLNDVLSYEVWATCLSESERKLLSQFLPSGKGAEQVVNSLLKGENLHFGNPYLKWSTSLCAGNLHPDILLQVEQQHQLDKRAYYCEINEYHNGMLVALNKWKERWLNCQDPEMLQSEAYIMNKHGNLVIPTEEVKVLPISKRELSHKVNILDGDTDKYMSYIKLSRAQLKLVKNIKHSGDGIQPKLLGRVLGDIKCFHVHPYKIFEEEEMKRLNEHWLQIANIDIPVASEAARVEKLGRKEWSNILAQELTEKTKFISDKEEETSFESCPQEPTSNGHFRNQYALGMKDNSFDKHPLESSPALNSDQEPSPITVNQEAAEETLQPDDNYSSLSDSVDNLKPTNSMLEPMGSLASAKHMCTANISDPYYHTTDNRGFASARNLSLRQPQLRVEHPINMIDLERDVMETEDAESNPSAFDVDSRASLFSSFYPSEMLSSFQKEPGIVSSYPQEHMNGTKQPGLQFLVANGVLPESSGVSTRSQESQELMEQRDVLEKGVYRQQIMPKKLYSTGYPNQVFPSVEQQNYPAVQSSLNGGTQGYNWLPDDDKAYNSWSAVESLGSGQCLGDSGNTDGSLYSVLSNKLSTCSPYDSSSSEQYVQARNCVGGAISSGQSIYGYAHNQFEKVSSYGAATLPAISNVSWITFPHQNPGLHSPSGKPYQRSWNQ